MTKRLEQDDKMLVAIHELLRSEVFSSPELSSMCNAFYHVIYGWLNKAFRFFEHIQKDDQVELVRDLTLLVLKNQSIVTLIWDKINENDGNIDHIADKIDIFSKVLKRPRTNLHKFLQVILLLTGNKRAQKGDTVAKILQRSKVTEKGSDSNLLAEMFALLAS